MILGYAAMLLVGLTLGLLGGGGSILTVPILVYIFKINPAQATGYSLKYLQHGQLNIKRGLVFALPGLIGIWLSRAVIVPNLPESLATVYSFEITKDFLIMFVFAVLMITASYSMIKGRTEKNKTEEPNLLFLGVLGFLVSLVTGFVGAGGGFLIVPSLALIGGLRMKAAVATSLFVITLSSLFGFATDVVSASYKINWTLLALSSVIAVVGLFVGVFFSSRVSNSKLKKGFGCFVLVAGTFILIQQAVSGR